MARAEIYIEDDEDGNVSLAVRYIDGADPKSGAHQLANACRKFLESNLTQVTEPQVTDAAGNLIGPLDGATPFTEPTAGAVIATPANDMHDAAAPSEGAVAVQ